MNIHEYQAKSLLKQFGVPLLEGKVAHNSSEARKVAESLSTDVWVVKAQIHAGGRGKGGGVQLARSLDEVEKFADQMIGMNLVTAQTGSKGKIVEKVYIESGCQIQKEYYMGVVIDHARGQVAFMGSEEGGVDIEQVAEQTPDKIHYLYIDTDKGFLPFQARQLAFKLDLPHHQATKLFKSLYEAFMAMDVSLLEINPLVKTQDGKLVALDAKMSFDSNALYRHPDVLQLRDTSEEDPAELEASQHDLAFIKLDGNIGCLVNGAGLAMATMDIIKLYGGQPANFLDVGGGASRENVTQAFKIILKDPHVKGILVNIFGGIMKCDIIAEGIIAATKELDLHVPLVVRLEGTNVYTGKEILESSGLNIIAVEDLADAALKITRAVGVLQSTK